MNADPDVPLLSRERPPDAFFGWGKPWEEPFLDPGIREQCIETNKSGWLWTAESCDGGEPTGAWTSRPDPFIRYVCRKEHVGHLLVLVRKACCWGEPPWWAQPNIYSGHAEDGTWMDVMVYIRGETITEAKRAAFMRVAQLAASDPPPCP